MTDNAERTAHAAFEDLAQQIWDQHKIRVDSVSFDWCCIPTLSGKAIAEVMGADMDSKSYRSER